jgi:NADH:ubiquinone oxidoreductase subunit 4 (subunit M)
MKNSFLTLSLALHLLSLGGLPPISSAIHSGILFKMGAHGLVQINIELLSHAHSIFSSW